MRPEGEKILDEVAADEPGTARDEDAPTDPIELPGGDQVRLVKAQAATLLAEGSTSRRRRNQRNAELYFRYRGPSRRGSCASRCSHVRPAFCIHVGANVLAPEMRSNAPPTLRHTFADSRVLARAVQ